MDYVDSVERQLDLPSNDKRQVIREIRTHFDEVKLELMATGVDEAQAEQMAAQRLGNPTLVASQISKVHSKMSWGGAVVAAAPLVAAALIGYLRPLQPRPGLLSAWFVLLVAFAALMTVGCIREFIRDRRPVWLATWLAGALQTVNVLVSTILTNHGFGRGGDGDGVFAALLGGLPVATIMVGVALWASWRSPKLRAAAILAQLCVFGVGAASLRYVHPSAIASNPWPYLAVVGTGVVLSSIIPAVIGVGVFALHRLSNAFVASLFLSVLLMLPAASGGHLLRAPMGAAYIILTISSVFFFARAGNWWLKTLGLCVPPVAIQLMAGLTTGWRTNIEVISAAGGWLASIILPVVLVPLLFEHTQSTNRVEIAR